MILITGVVVVIGLIIVLRVHAFIALITTAILISLLGVVAGAVLTVGLNILMIETFSLTRIPWYLVPSAMLMLLVVGQLAVYGPARRASSVPPAVATRTV